MSAPGYESILEKARKVQALAQDPGATEGERSAALSALRRLLERAGMSELDLKDAERTVVYFSYRNASEKTLLCQVVYLVCGSAQSYWVQKRGSKTLSKIAGYSLTALEAVDVRAGFEFYRKAWADHLEVQMDAFVQKHGIFGPSRGESEALDMKRLARVLAAMRGVSGESWRPASGRLESEKGALLLS